jgi:hypothetical protein
MTSYFRPVFDMRRNVGAACSEVNEALADSRFQAGPRALPGNCFT